MISFLPPTPLHMVAMNYSVALYTAVLDCPFRPRWLVVLLIERCREEARKKDGGGGGWGPVLDGIEKGLQELLSAISSSGESPAT